MSRIVSCAVLIPVAISLCFAHRNAVAQSSSAGAKTGLLSEGTHAAQKAASAQQATQSSTEKPAYALIPTLLVKPLDSKSVRVGDEVIAKTSVGMRGNGLVIPKGGKVIGHITEAQSRSKGDAQSSLGIAFDKVELADGKWLSIQGIITAVGPNPYPEVTTGAVDGVGTAGLGINLVPASSGGPSPTVTNMDPHLDRRKLVNPQSTGVIGIKNLSLDKNSVLTTDAKDLKLESRTQLVIRVTVKPPAN